MKLSNEIFTCEAALKLIELGDVQGIEILKGMGISTDSLKSIKQAINRKKTAIDLMDAKRNNENKGEAASFEKIVASVEIQLGYQVKVKDISLARWVGIIQTLKIKHEAQQNALKSVKK